MAEKKYVIPNGGCDAAFKAVGDLKPLKGWGKITEAQTILEALKAFIRWQDDELAKMIKGDPYLNDQPYRSESLNENDVRTGFNKAIRMVRRIYLAPEPEVPEEIKDLLIEDTLDGTTCRAANSNTRVIEAFQRGQKARK
jgi:hypothetical protein